MRREDVRDVVREAIREEAGVIVDDDTADLTAHGMDDEAFVLVVYEVEDVLGVVLADDAPFQVRTTDDIIRLAMEALGS